MKLIELKEEEMGGKKPPIKVPSNFVIAGGAVRRWFLGERQNSDIDFFRTDGKDDYNLDIDGLDKKWSTIVADNYMLDGSKIQVIKREYKSVSDLLSQFDFHHCQFAYLDDGSILSTKKAIITSMRKHLSLNTVIDGFELDTLRRAFKYQRQGYSPCSGTIGALGKMLQQTEANLDEQLEMSPGGGKKSVIRFD